LPARILVVSVETGGLDDDGVERASREVVGLIDREIAATLADSGVV
jgi:hypothetical protein